MAEEILKIEVNPFYLKKMKTFFKAMSHAEKGILTRKDYELMADRYKEIAQINTIREQQVRRKLLKIWDDFFEATSKIMPITPEVFAKCSAIRGNEGLVSVTTHYADVLFDLIDINADARISPSEFRLFHELYLLNDATADAAFKALDKENKGEIDYDTFVAAVIAFFQPGENKLAPESIMFGPLVN